MNALRINGNDLTLEAVREVAHIDVRRPVLLDPDAREAVNRARAVVDALVANNKTSYAVSYTHLDVYKRQVERGRKKRTFRFRQEVV